jgi:hypothetical protein
MGRLVVADANRFTTADQRYVARLYRDFLGREADPAGLAYFSQLLARQHANRFQVAQALLSSREAKIQAIVRTYLTFLGRGPTDAELNEGLTLLQRGGHLGQIEASIAGSDEYFQRRAQGTNAGFVAALHHDLLGRAPAPGAEIPFLQSVTLRRGPFSYIRASERFRAAPPTSGIPAALGLERLPQAYPATFDRVVSDHLAITRATTGGTTTEQLLQELEAGVPRSAVAAKLIASQERSLRTAGSLYGRFLFAPPTQDAVTLYGGALGSGVLATAVVAGVAAQPQYLGLGEIPAPPQP